MYSPWSKTPLFNQFVFHGKPHYEKGNWVKFNKIGLEMCFSQSRGSQNTFFSCFSLVMDGSRVLQGKRTKQENNRILLIFIYAIYQDLVTTSTSWHTSVTDRPISLLMLSPQWLTCCRARCQVSRCGHWAHEASWPPRTPLGPTAACSRASTAPPTGWSSWSGFWGSLKKKFC